MSIKSKILVRTPNWIGDHVMAMPFYLALKKAFPQAHITFLVPEALRDFNDTEFRDEKIVLSASERKISLDFFKKALSLRKVNYDLALTLPSSWSSALFLFLTGAKNRVGFSADGSDLLFHSSLLWKGNAGSLHKSELYLSLITFLTAHDASGTGVFIPKPVQKEKWIVIVPGASIPLREYPYFGKLVFSVSEKFPDHKLIVVGTKREEKYESQLNRLNLPNVESRIGKTTLTEVIELCSQARFVISNDSGVAHLSATLAGSETLVLMGPGDPQYILPLGGKAHALRLENLPCSPCEKPYCTAAYGYQACLKGLSPEIVLDKMKSLTL